jgi:hypothetical protein
MSQVPNVTPASATTVPSTNNNTAQLQANIREILIQATAQNTNSKANNDVLHKTNAALESCLSTVLTVLKDIQSHTSNDKVIAAMELRFNEQAVQIDSLIGQVNALSCLVKDGLKKPAQPTAKRTKAADDATVEDPAASAAMTSDGVIAQPVKGRKPAASKAAPAEARFPANSMYYFYKKYEEKDQAFLTKYVTPECIALMAADPVISGMGAGVEPKVVEKQKAVFCYNYTKGNPSTVAAIRDEWKAAQALHSVAVSVPQLKEAVEATTPPQ